jgi:hypothetical protein
MVHRLHGDPEVNLAGKTVEAISNPVPVIVVEFR